MLPLKLWFGKANTNTNGMVELEGVNSAKLSQVWREKVEVTQLVRTSRLNLLSVPSFLYSYRNRESRIYVDSER